MKLALALVVILLVLVLVALAPLLKARLAGARDKSPWPFRVKRPLSPPEQVLYFRLVAALPDHIVLAQVQMSRFLGVTKGTSKPKQWFNRINQKSVDDLVCGKDSTVIAAIELDDKTHARADRVVADETKDKALAAAGVRIIRWHVKSMPDAEVIKLAFAPPTVVTKPAAKLAAASSAE
jgi:hypothetical protein